VSSSNLNGGHVGDEVRITGMTLTGATAVTFGGVRASFRVDSEEQISAVVPPHGQTGRIAVTTPAGTGSTGYPFVVAPDITSLSRTSGHAGDTVTLYGTTLGGIRKVEFGNDVKGSTLIRSRSYDTLTVTIPTSALNGPISIYDAAGGASSEPFAVLPKITSFSPGSATAGKPVTIGGSGFEDVSDVSIAGVPATVTSVKLNTIVALVPDTAPVGRVVVTTAAGTWSTTGSFKPVPKLAAYSPSPAMAGGDVTLTGTNLGAATALKLGSRSLPVVVLSPTEVRTTLPANATTGPLTVTTPGGTSAPLTLTVVHP
jgi:hypothetical protein